MHCYEIEIIKLIWASIELEARNDTVDKPGPGSISFATMSVALQPVLRPSQLPSLNLSTKSTTYICQACRHARLLKRPKRPYTFTQLITLSDGSAFTTRTTSPVPVYRSSRDTRNAPLWNPSSKELQNAEDDEAGRLSTFRSRFGRSFDAGKETGAGIGMTATTTEGPDKPASEKKATKKEVKMEELTDDFGEEDDASMLELISSFGKQDKGSAAQIAKKKL